MFSYRFFLKQAWNITKRYRHLWFFGIFASLTAIGGEYQIIAQGLNNNPGGSFVSTGFFIFYSLFDPNFYHGISQLAATNPSLLWSILSVALLVLALVVVMTYLAITSQAALVEQSARIILSKKKKEDLSISEGLLAGRKHFWRVLALNITNNIVITLSFFIISLPLVFLLITDTSALALAYTLLFIIFVPISLSIALIIKYAIAARVLEGRSFVSSISKGLNLFQKNWLVSLEMALLLFLINFAVGVLTIAAIFLFFLPLLILSLQIYAPILTAISFILTISTMIVAASILNSFQISAWTGLYLHLQEKKGRSKLERIFQRKR